MKKIIVFQSIVATVVFVLVSLPSYAAVNPLSGKIIALDAGHGGSEIGAVNTTYNILEKDVNLTVVYATKSKLETGGAMVVLTREGNEEIATRKERVAIASKKCYALANRECDALISIHHNGSTDPNHDGTSVYITQKKDGPLGKAVYNELLKFGLTPEGLQRGGFGMTVYGKMPNTLTEAYYITNNWEAQQYLYGNRVDEESTHLYNGLVKYFSKR